MKKSSEKLKLKLINFKKTLAALEKSIIAPVEEARDLSGIIKDFEIVYEMSWKTLKLYLQDNGHETKTAKDTFSTAFELRIINDEDVWLEILSTRNDTVHIYDENLAKEIVRKIKGSFFNEIKKLFDVLNK